MKLLLLAGIALFVTNISFAQTDPDFIKYRGVVSGAQKDLATDNGFYTISNPTNSSALLSFNTNWSVGTFQLEAEWWGALRFRNKVDNTNWNEWKTIWHSGNFTPANYLGAKTGEWNVDA